MKKFFAKRKAAMRTKAAKIGTYNRIVAVIVLAIVILLNVFVSSLPETATSFDISAAQLYSLSSASKAVVTNLEDDVTIYWIVQSGQENDVIKKLLGIYESLSDHVQVVKKNPDEFPTFAEQYTDETVYNNSLVVECGDKNRYISYTDIYEYTSNGYSQSYATGFDGEGQITSAISYVTAEDEPQIYVLSGHNETALSDTFSSAIERENMETVDDFSLLTVDEIPEDCSCILINSPASDISEEEASMLIDYLSEGGKVMVLSGPQETEMPNLELVLEAAGVAVNEGIVVDPDRDHYAFQYAYNLLPTIESSDITDSLIDEGSNVIASVAAGLTIVGSSDYSVTPLLTTSDSAYSKVAGYSMTTTEEEEGDIDGPFNIAVLAENYNAGALVWVATDSLADDTVNSYSSGANSDFLMNALGYLAGTSDTLSIRSKSLDYTYLTIPQSQSTWIKIVMIGIVPILYLLYGIDEVFRRRKGVRK